MIEKEFTNNILDSISDGVFTVDRHFTITSFNKAAEQITAVKKEVALRKKCFEVFRSNMCEKNCPLQKTLKTGKNIIDKKGYCISSKGEKIPISVSTALLKDTRGNVLGGAETFRDLREIEQLKTELKTHAPNSHVESQSESMKKIEQMLPSIAQSDLPVLIQGETGTGKEVIAKAIHLLSEQKEGPFVAINCATFPESLLESELFGYKKGAFTGAEKDKLGRFALAEGGTLFLDEIGDISLSLQVKLLRVLQEGEYEIVGGRKPKKIGARIITATNRDLQALIKKETFREDFFYRINVINLSLPPLRERKEDILILAYAFLESSLIRQNKNDFIELWDFDNEVKKIFLSYWWPGNIRELENTIARMVALSQSTILTAELLPNEISSAALSIEDKDFRETIEANEKNLILKTLIKHKWNKIKTAEELKMHTTTLWRKIKRYEIIEPV